MTERRATRSDVRALTTAIYDYMRPQLGYSVFIITLAALLEGVGIVLLLPLAETVFAADGSMPQSGMTGRIAGWLAAAGFTTVMQQLAVMGLAFVLLVALRSWVLLRRDVLMSELNLGFVDEERRKFFVMLAHAEWPVIKRYRKAHLLDTMTNNIARLAQVMQFLTRGVVTLALALATMGAAFVISITLGFALVGMSAAGLVFAIAWSRRSHASGERLNRAHRGMMSETTRFLDGLKAAKAARAEDTLAASYSARVQAIRRVQTAFIEQQGRLRNGIQLLASVAALAVLLVGYGLLGLGGGELLVMAAVILRLAPNMVQTFSGVQSVAFSFPAYTALRAMEAELAAAHGALPAAPADSVVDLVLDLAAEALELRQCSVRVIDEQGEEVTLVQADAITIPPGSLVHVGGPSGAGKSTLVELVAGLHLPATGTVRCGGLALGAQTCRAWQSQVSFAPQEPFIFDGTVRENLCWPNLSPDEATIWQALEDASAASLVRGLPAGLDEPLLDGGARLSGGERQRLCLARALLRPAKLLVLDEATSAMDPLLEREIVTRLRDQAGGRIVLLVSHSRNALDLADLRIDVAEGEARLLDPA
ncbi:MAG: ABC transporter ATP-binding protein [Erythrobacter sp.]|nr:ABC transporter ATP-binding protein [Erythrobacter sp.]